MKFIYKGQRKFLILTPINLLVKHGTEYETKDKAIQKELLSLGFVNVKDKTEEGD